MSAQSSARPRVRFSLLWKVTIPFMILAMALGLGATYIANRVLAESEGERFLRQLVDSGHQATDAVVREEDRLLEIERLIANTEGVADAVARLNAEDLRALVLPIFVNQDLSDAVAILDEQGISLLALRRQPDTPVGQPTILRGEAFYSEWDFVQRVLLDRPLDSVGDKHVGLEHILVGDQATSVFFVAGPVFDSSGARIGAVLVGEYLEDLVEMLSDEAGANISIYEVETGRLIGTTLEPENPDALTLASESIVAARAPEGDVKPIRQIEVSGNPYLEVMTPFTARQATVEMGILGISQILVRFDTALSENRTMVVRFGAAALALIVIIGLLISNSITKPLVTIVEASTQVAIGNLEARVPERGSDEIGVLARTFNRMVEGLYEGRIYRDLLGRTVTPEVREQLRNSLSDGGALLQGREAKASVLFADLRGFTSMAEEIDPAEVMATLNQYFSGIVPIFARYGGVVNKFEGDGLMAFFGILPQGLPPQVSALHAIHAGLEILEYVATVNRRRLSQGLPTLGMGIGVSTGPVIAGGIGSEDRLHYTVIGDTVNTAQRIQQVTSALGGTAMVISEDTYRFLGEACNQFNFGRQGLANLKGKRQQVTVYEVQSRATRVSENLKTLTGAQDS